MKSIIIQVIVGCILVVFGYLIHLAITPKPKTTIKEVVQHDTITIKDTIKFVQESKPTIIHDTTGIQTISDSIKGTKNEVEYKIQYQYRKDTTSLWQVELKPLVKTITEYITSDTTKVVSEVKYIPKPFFADTYFYTTIVAVVLLLFAIIY